MSTEVETNPCVAAKPTPEHEWLNQLLGDWAFEGECNMGPDKPAMKSEGKETFRSLGGLWFVGEGESKMPDGTMGTMIMTLGYNPETKRYAGNWVGSMMTHMWIYDGVMDETKKILTLNAEGPDFSNPGKTAKYQDIIEIKSADHRILRSQTQGPDGKWIQFMEAHYKRVGK